MAKKKTVEIESDNRPLDRYLQEVFRRHLHLPYDVKSALKACKSKGEAQRRLKAYFQEINPRESKTETAS